MAYGPGWFTRVWNSTLGLPQQYLYRIANVLRGRADLLSEEGLLDASLLPFVGVADDHRNDLSGKDIFGNHGWAGNLLLELATDPTTYMTFGASAAARSSRAIVKAADAAGLQRLLRPGATAAELVGDMRAASQTGLVKLADRARMNSFLDAAEGAAGKADWWKVEKWDQVQRMATDHELLYGPPVLAEKFGFAFRVPTAHKTWTGLLVGHPIEATASKAYAYLGSRQNIVAQRALLPLVRPIAAFSRGASVGTTGRFLLDVEEVSGPGLDDVIDRVQSRDGLLQKNTDIVNSWGGKLEKHQGKGLSAEESFRRLWGIKAEGETTAGNIDFEWAKLREQLGLAEAPITFNELRSLWRDAEQVHIRDRELLINSGLRRRPTNNQELLRSSRRAWEAGEKMTRGFHRLFVGDTGFKVLDESGQNSRQAVISYERDIEARAGLIEGMYVRLAKQMGMDTPDGLRAVKQSATRLLEIAPHADEISFLAKGQQEASADLGEAILATQRATTPAQKEAAQGLAEAALRDTRRAWQRDVKNWLSFRLPDAANLSGVEASPINALMERGFKEAGIPRELGKTRKALGGPYGKLKALQVQGLEWVKQAEAALVAGQQLDALPPAFWDEMATASDELSERVMRPLLNAGGEATEDLWTALRDLQGLHLKYSGAYGFVGRSLPVAWVPRILSAEETGRVQELLGSFDQEKLANILGRPRASRVRHLDRVGVMELNAIVDDLRKWDLAQNGDSSIRELIESIAKHTPEIESKYVDDAASAFLTSLSSMKEIESVATLFDDINALSMNARNGVPVMGARVVGAFSGGRVQVREGRKISSKILGDGRIASRLSRAINGLPEKWLVMERADGGQFVMPLASTENGMVIARVGAGEKFGETAAVNLSKQGRFSTVGALSSDADIATMVKDGEWALVGDQAVMSGIQDAAGKTLMETPTWVRAGYDTIHSYFKAANTVVKPSFYLFNYASSPMMLSTAGASMDAILGGFRDAARFLRKDLAFDDVYGRQAAWQAETMPVVSSVAGRGVPGTRRTVTAARQARIAERPRDYLDVEFNFGAGRESLADTFKVWRESGLLNTFGSEGLRGLTRESKRLAQIQRDVDTLYGIAEKGDLFDRIGNFTAVGKEALSRIGEAAEIQTRFAGYFAFRRMGLSQEVAARAAKEALVDYGALTQFERTWMKRGMSFYTFPRKMLPTTFKRIARDPGGFGVQARALFGLPVVDADSGTLEARLGDYRANIQRGLPQLDAISAGAFAADWLFNWDAFKTTPERMGNSPFGLAIPLDVVRSGLGASFGGGAEMWRSALRNAATTRWAVSGHQDRPEDPEDTMYDHAMRFLIGVDKPGQMARKKWLKGQYDMLLQEARERIRQEPDNVDFWRDEIQALTATTQRLLQP